ncbi:hypothetical protein [Chryseobacterium sp. MP_3.2]|uniref:hypothetical protein n=1 Tax=Chryseobacterium sp. MP_3.2 TaxID=3071712 RepID=UPI002E0A3285|nr:hypothetical protein [Chryseobacterium sp. MP_3.2]
MKYKFYLFFLLFLTTFYDAQSALIPIPGTKFSMVPPNDFELSSDFTGFQSEKTKSSIIIVDFPAAYSLLKESFTKEALLTKGMELISKENVKYNNVKAQLYKVRQKAFGKTYLKQILIFGDETKTVIVNGIYPEEFLEMENDIKTALFTLTFDENQNPNSQEAAQFSINTAGTTYQFVKNLAGALMYSEDGLLPTQKGRLLVSGSLGEFSTLDPKKFTLERLKALPDADQAEIKSVEKITIDHRSGYEIIAADHKKDLLYFVAIFSENRYYLIVGGAKEEQEKNLEIFKKIARTFKVK